MNKSGRNSAMGFFLSFLVFFLIGLKAFSQPGCQDPVATNFNPGASSTNSSCTYPVSNAPLTNRISALPAILTEASALLVTDGKVFTINDSGNSADIFEIDSVTGLVKKKTRIINYPNTDWEDIAADSLHIYVGDFGNNNGNRTDLHILKLKKSTVYHSDSLSVKAERLGFSYPDQTSFVSGSSHNFDCESVFYFNGKLHLFSKNRGNKKTKHYSLDPNLPSQVATLHDSLDVNGLITSASISPDRKTVALLGLDQSGSFPVFSWLLFGFNGSDFFRGNRRRIELPNLFFTGQAEGIGFVSNSRLWVSNEALGNIPARVKELNVEMYLKPFFTDVMPIESIGDGSLFFPNPVSDVLKINVVLGESYSLVNAFGKQVYSGLSKNLDVTSYPSGLYFISVFKTGNQFFRRNSPIIIQH